MARATRSTRLHDNKAAEDTPPPVASKAKAGSKKRKRSSVAGTDEPAAKQPRTDTDDDAVIKEEVAAQPEVVEKPPETKGAGDVPLDPEDAQRILDILETVDTQGLLDRVFPLPADPAEAAASDAQSSQPRSYSFRTLLKEYSRHPLRVLRSAVQPLFPVFAHPRSRPSAPAAEQLKFCHLALSLLDQSSFNCNHSALDIESIIPDRPDAIRDDSDPSGLKPAASTLSSADVPRKRKYALMQKLPTGEWWTSLNSDFASPTADGKDLKDLPTAHAEVVAILPDPTNPTDAAVPTLGSYTRKAPAKKPALPGARRVSVGAFLDYGPYASFAPTFDQDGREVGRVALGEVIWQQERQRKLDAASAELAARREAAAPAADTDMEDVAEDEVVDVTEDERRKKAEEDEKATDEVLEALLPAEEVASLKEVLGSLELEQSVQELLERNSRALKRLEKLQLERLGGVGGGSSKVEVDSEEWDVAQGIADSLTLLASLRPRSSTSDASPLVPSPSVLRKLHRTLPTGPSEGWYGSLPPTTPIALRDDTTLHIKSGVTIPTVAPPVAPPAAPSTPAGKPPAAAPAASAAPSAPPYANYAYPGYPAGQQYRGAYPYTPTTSAYYPHAYAQTPGAPVPTSAPGQPTQYAAAGAQPYGYGAPWYGYQPGTPAPATPGGTPSYSTFFNGAAGAGGAQRAVANTVAASKNGWQGAQSYTPMLPAHLRGTAAAAAPGTPSPAPTPAGSGYSYYPGYAQPSSTAAAAAGPR
ncbi:hypothetical protein FA95DRAFT_1589070 [Auriscalpium vulgare]|uniref:Uncharacterized protein n=1 Tax=Auriscalpium vulgare TaxID=40419 RepID=A0ACB8RV10_9AGAM|nr:hypothetical protein FA95DRAFT_1589070 [Auriscalpium vulgare]